MSIPGPQEIERHELDNGIVVLVRENRSSPAAVVSGYLAVGAYDESPQQAGLAAFTASTLTRGTIHRTFDQIYEQVESIGASMGVSGGTHNTVFGAKSLGEDLGLVLDVLGDVLRHPTFPAQEVEKRRGEILTRLEERAHDTQEMADLAFYKLAYPADHPYSRSQRGYPETISALTRDDLAAFYRDGYGPRGMVIALVGAVSAKRAVEQVEAAFGDWNGATRAREPLPAVPRIQKVRQEYVPIPGKTQADIVLGYPGPSRADPTFYDAVLANTILGIFGMMGRLGETVREAQGLAYYSYSQVKGGLGPDAWAVIAGVHPQNVARAIDSIRAEIRRMCQEPPQPDELSDSQAYLTGSLPLLLETNEGVAQSILNIERHGLDYDYLQRYSRIIQEITAERVQAAAQRWLDPDAYAVAVAGPPMDEEWS
ncbi:MAG: insulinase family protein [Anaerolineae bacterium]|nr:insulinase family protein [Anaerolineae bacterium]